MDKYSSSNFVVLFGSIKKKIYKILNDKIKKYDLSFPEAIYLMIISKNVYGISFKDLTKEADCDKGMTTRVIKSLESKGLISTIDNKKIILVTELGKDISFKLQDLMEEFKEDIFNRIEKNKLKDLYDSLNELNNLLEGDIKC